MKDALILMVMFGVTNAAIIFVLIYKWGLIDSMKPRSRFWEEFWNCDFCKAFWMAFFEAGCLAIIHPDPYLVMVPLGAALISSRLL